MTLFCSLCRDSVALGVALHRAGRDTRSRGRRLSSDGLTYFEAFQFRMLQIERTCRLITGSRVRGSECFRFGPRLEGLLTQPHAMNVPPRAPSRMVLDFGTIRELCSSFVLGRQEWFVSSSGKLLLWFRFAYFWRPSPSGRRFLVLCDLAETFHSLSGTV
jgi:hypothetical protein